MNKCMCTVELKDGHRLDCFSLFFTRPEEDWKMLRLTKVLMDDKTYKILCRYKCEWKIQNNRIMGVKLCEPGKHGEKSSEKLHKDPGDLADDLADLTVADEPEEGAPEEKGTDDDGEHGAGAEAS